MYTTIKHQAAIAVLSKKAGIITSTDFKLYLWYDTCENDFSGVPIFQAYKFMEASTEISNQSLWLQMMYYGVRDLQTFLSRTINYKIVMKTNGRCKHYLLPIKGGFIKQKKKLSEIATMWSTKKPWDSWLCSITELISNKIVS